MRDIDTRVGPCRTVGDPPHESVAFALHRAARELGPLFDLGGYGHGATLRTNPPRATAHACAGATEAA